MKTYRSALKCSSFEDSRQTLLRQALLGWIQCSFFSINLLL
jgi:hypothetical protein